jgi:hypothetical protein
MAISGILSSKLIAAYISPLQEQPQVKSPKKTQGPDTVFISKLAQQLARDGEPQTQEVIETAGEQETENSTEKE